MYPEPTKPGTLRRYGHRGTRLSLLSVFLTILLAACSNLVDEPKPTFPEGEPPTTNPGAPFEPGEPGLPGDPGEPESPTDPSDPAAPEPPSSPGDDDPTDPRDPDEDPGQPSDPGTPDPGGPDDPHDPGGPSDSPSGGPALGALLWQATHESGDQREWYADGGGGEYNSGTGDAWVSSKYARSGKYSLLMRIDTSRGGGGTRQFRWNELDNIDTITTIWAYLPHHISLDRLNDWFNFIQWKTVKWAGKPGGDYEYNDPLWSLDIHERGGPGSGGPNFLKLVNFDDPRGVSAEDAPKGMDLPVGEWFKITTHFRRGTGTNGFIRVWLNDELMFDKQNIQTMRPDQSYTGWSVNAYADITYPRVTEIYVDDVTIHLPR
ncbi:MAG TPA: heparin lyase I family protein [Trueperaceae bacterium]|nr:heparin lyase I family protein [Trueperaceae bacterium]